MWAWLIAWVLSWNIETRFMYDCDRVESVKLLSYCKNWHFQTLRGQKWKSPSMFCVIILTRLAYNDYLCNVLAHVTMCYLLCKKKWKLLFSWYLTWKIALMPNHDLSDLTLVWQVMATYSYILTQARPSFFKWLVRLTQDILDGQGYTRIDTIALVTSDSNIGRPKQNDPALRQGGVFHAGRNEARFSCSTNKQHKLGYSWCGWTWRSISDWWHV